MDKVKLHPQERLDLDDTRALQSLVYDYISEALGGLMGHAHGVLSVPTATTYENNGAPTLYLRPFTFVTSAPMETGTTGAPLGTGVTGGTAYMQFKSIVVNYDDSEQPSVGLDIDNLREDFDNIVTNYGFQYIWARPITVDTDTATRRKWDVTSGAEVTFSDATRERQHVAFLIQNAEPTYAAGEARWAKVAQITSFTDGNNTGSVPNVRWFSVFDDPLIDEFLEVGSNDASMELLLTTSTARAADFPLDGTNKSYRTFALPLLLTAIRERLRRIQGTYSWLSTSTTSLSDLNTRTTTLESRQLSPTQCIANCTVAVDVQNETNQQFVGSYVGNSYGVDRTYTSIIRNVGLPQNRANIKLNTSLLEQGWAITHISVQQHIQREPQTGTPTFYDYNRVTFLIDGDITTVSDTSAEVAALLLDDISPGTASTDKGVVIEFLPHVVDTTHSHGEADIEPPLGNTNDATPILRALAGTDHDLIFSVAVFAVPTADADS